LPSFIRQSQKARSKVEVRKTPHIVLGVTSAQTCLVLKGRVRALRAAGFFVTVISSPGSLLDELARAEGAERVEVSMRRAVAPLSDLCSLVQIWRILCKLQPDIVEFSTPKAGLLGMLAAWLARVPRRVYLLRGLKLETASGAKRKLLVCVERLAMACAQTVMCNSASLATETLALRLTSGRKVKILGAGSAIGVDCEHYSPKETDLRAELGIPDGAMVVGFTGRLTHDKGVPLLFEAFEDIRESQPGVYLLLVGWWDEAEDAIDSALREKILRHSNVRCTGFVRDVAPYLRAMDIFALPTRREGLPNAILEASATALPIVTTDATGARDAVVHGLTGLMVPAGSSSALQEALLKLLYAPQLRERMGREGRRWVQRNFERRHVLARNAHFYRDLLRQDPERPQPRSVAAD
jgi:glycosyltransferase involved in cell wall biosynthesis